MGINVVEYLFDIMYYDQYDLTELTLESRKKILKQSIIWESPIYYTDHRKKNGIKSFKEACQKGWEGLIAKNVTVDYVHSRSKNWLKFKCSLGQELVIGGFTEPKGSRIGFGALLVGYYNNNELLFTGIVGTALMTNFLGRG